MYIVHILHTRSLLNSDSDLADSRIINSVKQTLLNFQFKHWID